MLATPHAATTRTASTEPRHGAPRRGHATFTVALAAASLVLVPAGAALAATGAGGPAAARPAHANPAASRAIGAALAASAGTTPPFAQAAAGTATIATGAAPAAALPAPATAPAPVVDDYKTASVADLEATGLVGHQEDFTPTAEQWANAATITRVAKQRGMDPYAAVIAVAVAMQESSLKNIKYGDRDSLGLFQQRPSMGWGSAAQVTDPAYAAGKFLSVLQRQVPGYKHATLWKAAQAVQGSGFPTAYAKWQKKAAQMVHAIAA